MHYENCSVGTFLAHQKMFQEQKRGEISFALMLFQYKGASILLKLVTCSSVLNTGAWYFIFVCLIMFEWPIKRLLPSYFLSASMQTCFHIKTWSKFDFILRHEGWIGGVHSQCCIGKKQQVVLCKYLIIDLNRPSTLWSLDFSDCTSNIPIFARPHDPCIEIFLGTPRPVI